MCGEGGLACRWDRPGRMDVVVVVVIDFRSKYPGVVVIL